MTPDPSTLPPREQTRAFLDALLAGVEPGFHALLWTRQDKRSHWHPAHDPAGLTDLVTTLGDRDHDVYLAVSAAASLPPAARRDSMRIDAASSAGLYGLWADVDIRDADAHKKWNYPASEAEALDLVRSLGIEPSIVVHSGHGLQVWWLFDEFRPFDSEADRVAHATLAARWNGTLRARAAERGLTVDSVYDLARVMRVPGPSNHKGAPVPVRLLQLTDHRYLPDDIEAFCLDPDYLAAAGLSPTRSYVAGELDLSENGKPPFEKLNALVANSDIFESTWKRQRKDFLDQSPSVYDMSLASQAVQAGWSDQEIADLLTAFRQQHGLDVAKVTTRPDYVARTIGKAREGHARDAAVEEVDEAEAALDAAREAGDPDAIRTARQDVLDVIGAQLGLQVTHVWRYSSEPPTFRLETPTHVVPLGGADGVLRQDRFRQAVWETTGHQIDRFKPNRWDDLTRLIPKAWEVEDVGFEATEAGETHGWLQGYLEHHPPSVDVVEAVEQETAWQREDGRVALLLGPFGTWVRRTRGERVSDRTLAVRLRTFGCERTALHLTLDGQATTRSAWLLPERKWTR